MDIIDRINKKFDEYKLGDFDTFIQEDSEWIDVQSETKDFEHMFNVADTGYVLFCISYNRLSEKFSGGFYWCNEESLFNTQDSDNLDNVARELKENYERFLTSTGAFVN
jgi:hypothetical protein